MFPQAFGLHPVVQRSVGASGERFTHLTSMNKDVIARFDFCGKPDHVPICQANAAVAHSASDRTWIVRPMNADAFLVKGNPHTPTGFRGPGGSM